MKKWMWITAPALAVGLGLVFLGGSVFAQNTGNTSAPTVNWTAMYDYCRNVMTGNATPTANDLTQMSGYCQNATAAVDVGAGCGGAGGVGMMGNPSVGRGMMGW